MKRVYKFLKSFYLWIFALMISVGGVLVYASVIDTTEYKTESLVIIPDVVSSDTWEGLGSVLSQDVFDDALYQDFSESNSAYVPKVKVVEPEPLPLPEGSSGAQSSGSEEVQDNEPADTVTDVFDEVTNDVAEIETENSIEAESEPEVVAPEPEPEVEVVEPEPEPEPEAEAESDSEPVSDDEVISYKESNNSVFYQVLTKVRQVFPFAQQTVEEPVLDEISAPETESEPEVEVVEPEPESVDDAVEVEEVVDDSSGDEDTAEVFESDKAEDLSVEAGDVYDEDEFVDQETISETFDEEETGVETSNNEESEFDISQTNEADNDEVSEEYSLPDCDISKGCESHSILFSGFELPDFESGTVLDTAQLRLSLAAKEEMSSVSKPQRLLVEYSYGDSADWRLASLIEIDDEISNSINGGYFLVTLEDTNTFAKLSQLKVRLTYEGDRSGLENLFLESLWLDVTAGEFYESGNIPEELSDTLDYKRELLAPSHHILNNPDIDPSLSTLPSFTLTYETQENLLKRVFNAIFSENTFAVESITLRHNTKGSIDVPFKIEYYEDNTWSLHVEKQPQKLYPGKYTIDVKVKENDHIYSDSFEFYWGVLAVNTKKSIYFENESVTLNLAALTDKGNTICDADLRLKIIDPDNNIYEVPVEQTGSCGPNNVTEIPDYIANFQNTDKLGKYIIQLESLNTDQEVVHKIRDSFEVREYIPFDIERTAPTRIYPPAPYEVTLNIKANRSFVGDITERVPRGFVFESTGGAEVSSFPEFTLLTWKDVEMAEGDELTLSYEFDAPDISPYLYLLGPLDMDGFTELRQWQIASDALGGVAWLTGTETVSGTDLNSTPAALLWSTSTIDNYYFDHSTGTDSEKLNINRAGDYLVAVNVPMIRTDSNNSRTRIGAEVRVNGTAVPQGYGRSSYIRSQNSQLESSSNVAFLLSDLEPDDYIEVYLEGLTTIDAGDDVVMSGQAGLYVEYISPSETIFAATTTQPIGTTSLNEITANEMVWTETRQDTGFVHSNVVNPEDITISDPGSYLVTVNIPITAEVISGSTLDERNNIQGRVLLDGGEVPAGQFAQGYIRGPETEDDGDASIHWSGVVTATSSNQVLSISVEREAIGGNVTVTPGAVGSIFIQKLPVSDVLVLRGRDLSGGTDWSNSPAESVLWDTHDVYDSGVFTHSTTSNQDQITVNQAGDYLLVYNDSLTSNTGRGNTKVTVEVDGTPVSGAETKSHFTRDATSNVTSGSLTFLLEGVSSSSVIEVFTEQEGANATFNDTTDAMLMLWKKAELDLRPEVTADFDTPFDNIKTASTTPVFSFSGNDPDGSSSLEYQISFSTTTDFSASTTRTSGVDSGFSNLDTPADTSPFNEGEQINFQLQGADALSDSFTYYWRVRARDTAGSNTFGDWTTVQSITIDLAASADKWYQSFDGQFETNNLIGARVSGNDNVEVDVVQNSEILIAYGEASNSTPRYRFWDGTQWGPELGAQDVGSTNINWVVTKAGTTRDEYVMVTLGSDADVNAQIYTASTTSWGNLNEISTNSVTVTTGGIAAAYETLSGDAIVVGCSSGADPVYSIWNGSSWSATSSINVTTSSDCRSVIMESDPVSDEIILVYHGDSDDYEAFVWDGSAWGNSLILGTISDARFEGMDVIYEESGDQAIVVSADGTDNEFLYATWDGTDWSTVFNIPHNTDFENGHLVRDVGTDNVALCFIDNQNDVQTVLWYGTAWDTIYELTASGNSWNGRPVDCEFETTAGRDGNLIVPYSDTIDDQYQVYSGSWSGELDLADMTDSWFVQAERAGDGTIITVFFDDVADDLLSSVWNGTSWTNSENLETSPEGINPNPRYESYSMSAKIFQYTVGTVKTNPIDFSFVPNQPTWGDINFDVTEPVGTAVSVQVYYTATTTCDSLIPDGSLSGNSGGFTTADLPIDLSGLSTTTYNQICLGATLTTNGGNSATLNEWALTWEREVRLIQNNYRWYDNISALTPTDPWPAGANDLAENSQMTNTEAISNSEEVRLRMSILGSNVSLAAFSSVFRLQYAEKISSCTPTSDWYDVGDSASTTALWRGFENAIVGSDWYDEDWARRIKITIDSALVSENLTDFPVYADLSDLPAGFFYNVQSDGDDIRITESDGLTEVPYDLVSINTGGQTGELHFKGDISSSTDTEFYIYYSNPAASGYSVSDTYGSENVWTNNFDLRYAMDESPVAASPQFKDSTSNGNNAVARAGMTAGDVVAGKIGDAINHDGNDGGVFQSGLSYSGQFTASMWWRSQVIADGDGFAISQNTGSTAKLGPWSSNTVFVRTISSSDQTVASPANGSWAHIVLTRDASNKVDLYVNGVRSRLYSDVAQSGASLWENFGGQTTQGFEGDLDEIRFADVKRSDGWVSAEYANQVNPTGFYAVSSEELISDGKLLPSTLLTDSDYPETYEEENPTRENQNTIGIGDEVEWDFVLQNNNAAAGTEYCFRMIYDTGGTLAEYNRYPTLVTNGPPDTPTLEAPFDNEKLASTTPWFEFYTDDSLGDEVSYEIQIDTDYNFGSPVISKNSLTSFSQFTNIQIPSERSQYTSGQTIRFIPATALSNGTTYWWRVRATDPDGSNTAGEWSVPYSFTVDTSVSITTWYQTTQEQFDTNNLDNTITNVADDVRLDSGQTIGTTTSTAIDFDDVDIGNAWGQFDFNDNLNGGTIKYFIEYEVGTNVWSLVPDSVLSGNSSGFTSGPVVLIGLDTEVYNVLRVVAVHEDTGGNPEIDDWTLTWGQRVEVPTLLTPFDNAKVSTTSPSLTFYTTDPQDDYLEYEVQISSTYDFMASTTYLSGTDSGFSNLDTPADTTFISGDTIQFDIPLTLTSSSTYWWRVRARDPGDSNVFSFYSDPHSFTVDESIIVSTWFQTTGEQFDTDSNSDIETFDTEAKITTVVREAMAVYSEIGSYSPKYRFWDGSDWGDEMTAEPIDAFIEFSELEATIVRDEYALATLGDNLDVDVQIYDGNTSTWGDLIELTDNATMFANDNRPFDISYEQSSGDLMAVMCDGSDAFYTVWNGSSWSATTTISLTSAEECRWIELVADPASDEILMGVRHVVNDVGTGSSPIEFEFVVWNGSSWGNAVQFGQLTEDDSKGFTLGYEESGNQAIVIASDRNNAQFRYDTWNGSAWSGSTTVAIGDDFEWGVIAQDSGSDNLMLCYIDNAQDLGVLEWDGSAWDGAGFTEYEITGETKDAQAFDCEYQTTIGNDGNVLAMYSDTSEGRYQEIIAGAPQGEVDLSDTRRSDTVTSIRTADGVILAGFNEFPNPDSYRVAAWNGTSWDTTLLSNIASKTTRPFLSSLGLAARLYPNFTQGSIRSTTIDYDDGSGPSWDSVLWNDDTPGASSITYRVYYEQEDETYALIPDIHLAGNSTGFTTSPINIKDIDRLTYDRIKIQADLLCDSGDCPTLYDWSVKWSEGIDVTGSAYEYNGATTTSGTVAVAVNGVLQSGKTGTIQADGSWSIANVTMFADDTVMVYVDGVGSEADKSVAVTTYDGTGQVTGMDLRKRYLTIGSDDIATTTNAAFNGYDNTDDPDIFFTLDGSNYLNACVDTNCAGTKFVIKPNAIYRPAAGGQVIDFINYGTFLPEANTFRVQESWTQNGEFVPQTSTIIFTATSTSETLNNSTSTHNFYNVTFGETAGGADWTIDKPLDVDGALVVDYGTLARGTSTINVARNLRIGAGGNMTGLATTTFDGTGSFTWTDTSPSTTNIGHVVIDGEPKTITLGGNVAAESITIGANDTLNSSGSAYNINVYGNWTNYNSFIPQNGTVTFVGTSTGTISRGASAFNNLTFAGVGGDWSFTTPNLVVNSNLTIATGTVTLATATTSVGGSFLNTGGVFAHNNGEVRMTSNSGGKSITQNATTFLNAFYDLVFTGNGSWAYTESNATTSHDMTIKAGSVTLPNGQLTVGGDFITTASGAFNHNNGELVLLVEASDSLRTNGSSLNDVRIISGVASSWYNDNWEYRVPVTVQASQVDDDLANFPVYVDLANLPTGFFNDVNNDGGDIRVTLADGMTEVPREIVSIDTGGDTGELHFRATALSSSTDTVFYIYFGNSGASDYADTDPYGAENVWSNGYTLVEHMNDLTTSSLLNSRNSSLNGTKASANNPLEVSTGKIYEAQDNSADDTAHGNIFAGSSDISFSGWFNPDNLTGSGDTATYGYSIFGVSPSGAPYTWLTAGGSGYTTELRLCAWENSATGCSGTSGANLATGNWYFVAVSATDGGATTVRVNGQEVLSYTNAGSGVIGTNFTIADLRPGRNIEFDGRLDEFRAGTSLRTAAWQDATYVNQATTTDFYNTGIIQSANARTFTDTNATILGDLVLETGGDAVFPSGQLSIGGSLDNNAEFDANNGTVRFNSTAGSETIAVGNSSFDTVTFNSATGDFTVTENATATVAFNLTSASQFTLDSGITFETQGTFSNSADGANTTWTGSTLLLSDGGSLNINTKTSTGDDYATLTLVNGTDVTMWNSTALVYNTNASSSVYSQDHSGVDGDLYIFGEYERNSGTEYWSYATDFDGIALIGTSTRQVNVRVANNSSVNIDSSTFNIIGSAVASTTIDVQSGSFELKSTNSTLNARYLTVTGTDTNGLQLTASTTLTQLANTRFTIPASASAISIDASTIDTNPAKQLFDVDFVTGGGNVNVTLIGSPTSFVWFRDGRGDRYGEAFDNADGDPGSIRFDDSSYTITIAGTVYADDGVTTLGGPTCDGVTPNVRVVVDGGTYASSTACSGVDGSYSLSGVAFVGDPKLVVYLDTNGGVNGTVVTKTPTTDISNMDIYSNRIITRHEDVLPLAISDMTSYTSADDSDINFTAATGTPDTLILEPNTELYVFADMTFTPNGNVTLNGNGNNNSYEGTLSIGSNAIFNATGTETHTLAGRLVLATTSTLSTASSTFIFNATTTGKSITSPNPITFNELDFTGVGGDWNITAPLTVLADMDISAGTVTGTSDITLVNGSLSGNGVVSLGGGTVTLNKTNNLGGTSAWNFNNLTLGNGSLVGTTTPIATATTTVLGTLTIANAHFLEAGSSIWDLNGTGTVFVETGTFLEDTSRIRYSGANANVLSTGYYDLELNAAAGTPTYTAVGAGINVLNDITVGGSAATVVNFNTNDTVLAVGGDFNIYSNGTFEASNSALLTISGNYNNDGVFNSNSGSVLFNGSGSQTIEAGNSSFGNVEVNGVGSFTISESATTTGNFVLTNHSVFTLASSNTLAIGAGFTNSLAGSSTVWTGSDLLLYGGGTRLVNSSATQDSYDSLSAGDGTYIRMWNSDANTYNTNASGGIYSQDHSNSDGQLNIYGTILVNSGNDYWSYTTDFDGTSLSGGSEREVNVTLASGSSITYSGGSLEVIGSSTASTTISNQGSGNYNFDINGTATTNWNYVTVRDVDADGINFSGTPIVNGFSRTDHLVELDNATAITVAGTVINANPAKNFTNNIFAESGSPISPANVTASGVSVSSWRFTNHSGNLAGEAYDEDPDGDPGYVVWDDSAALITISGNVYSDEGTTVSGVCDNSTPNILLRVAGLTTASTSCNSTTGAYSISNVSFSPNDTLTLYISGESEKAANVTIDPISSISNMHLYENRVIVRHENTDPITIADMSVWDSSDDADIPFTAVDSSPDTLTLPADFKLLVWNGKTFEPNGNITLSGGGAGADYDGTLEVSDSATFRAKGTESHSVGGSMIFGSNAVFVSGQSTFAFTTTGASRVIDVNEASFYDTNFTGVGSWSFGGPSVNISHNHSQSAGNLTFGSATTTIGASFNATGGAFDINDSSLLFISTTTGNTVRFDDSEVADLYFVGAGGAWSMTDTNATTTGSLNVTAGTLTLPSGNLAVASDFDNNGGSLVHNTSNIIMTATTSAVVRAGGSDLFGVSLVGSGSFTMLDSSLTLLDDLTIANGLANLATGTLSIGGSFDASAGTFNHASGSILFNASAGGKIINSGVNDLYNVVIGAPSGGYTMYSATTTNNFTITNVSSLVLLPTQTLTVNGVFTNSVGGAATTWTDTNLILNSGTAYSLNTRLNSGDTYNNLIIGPNTDIRMWNSSATTSVDNSSSLYSQDNAGIDGDLYIYGDFVVATTTEYWSYATDFDGTALGGGSRAVQVKLAENATTTVQSGSLRIIGASGFETDITNQATGTYAFFVNGGSLNASYYSFDNMDINGLNLSGTPTITSLSNGYYEVAVNTAFLITLSSTTLNANASKIFDNVGFNASGSLSGFNVNLVGETSNAWKFTNSYGNIGGEGFDIDGVDACGSIRFDDSSCLLTEQTHVRWRNDDGGEGVPTSEWFDTDWDYRKRVRIDNDTNQAYSSSSVKIKVTYDSDMQSDFEDLRFTSDDGLTEIPYWIEKYTASAEAEVWVRVPTLVASDISTVFMYYGNGSATTTSSGASTFDVFDDYEDNNISEYSGNTSLFQTSASLVYGGSYGLKAANTSGRTNTTLYRTDQTTAQGQIIRYMQYIDTTAGSGDEACTLFGVQGAGTNYAVCLEQFGTDRISVAKDVVDNDTSGSLMLGSTTVTYATGWYEVEIDWQSGGDMDVSLYTAAGSLVATVSASNNSYTSGGIGYAFWFQSGGWDSYTARPRAMTKPTVYFGDEQTYGGATWASAQDSFIGTEPGVPVRLRLAVENSGLDITNQTFQLEYAAKGVAPSCESVASVNYVSVPNQASCGSSPICMATSSNVTNGESTTDLLSGTNGAFSAGSVVTSPSSITSSLDVDQNFYTELEYAIVSTINASDGYCLRVTNNGTDLDSYATVAEMSLSFDPTISSIILNEGNPITLQPGATTTVYATGTVSDLNGYSDLVLATSTIYRSGAGAACVADTNNCYISNTSAGSCSFTDCAGSTCTIQCQADIYYNADPTDDNIYEGEEWLAYVEVEDAAGGYDFSSAMGVELMTLRYISTNQGIDYGTLEPAQDTGANNASTTIYNLGNDNLDIDIEATDLSNGLSSIIPATEQKFSTSTFTYNSCGDCGTLSSSTIQSVPLDLPKPSTPAPFVNDVLYWGINVPFGTAATSHQGVNTLYAVGE